MKLLLLLLLAQDAPRTVVIDERLARDAGIEIGDRVVVSAEPGSGAPGDTVIVSAIARRPPDPSEVARGEYVILMHLDHLQQLIGYGDRVDRFAVATTGADATDSALAAINRSAFGFRAHRSTDVAVETSRTFQVVSRFHRAIGVITIVASAVFLLCIMLLKVEERRRETATLRLLGISRRSVLTSMVAEASLIALFGSLMGAGLGQLTSVIINAHYQGLYRTPLLFAIVTPGVLALSVLLSILLGVGAGLLAAYRLVRARPLELLGR